MKTIQMIKTTIALLFVVALLLVGGTALAQTGGPGPAPERRVIIQAGPTIGGGYQLTSLTWRVIGTAGGGRYNLVAADRVAGGNQCCCTYLPIVLRNK
ncbi:MAG: hypothetical protein KKA73_03925 [Chloroflexi bacterium]|nr:hypothetical protein [Chloroflexota bacterium]MBU1746813.1 hypothetical protein [Chloroflexota bacterium]